jgi:hypothetical protein
VATIEAVAIHQRDLQAFAERANGLTQIGLASPDAVQDLREWLATRPHALMDRLEAQRWRVERVVLAEVDRQASTLSMLCTNDGSELIFALGAWQYCRKACLDLRRFSSLSTESLASPSAGQRIVLRARRFDRGGQRLSWTQWPLQWGASPFPFGTGGLVSTAGYGRVVRSMDYLAAIDDWRAEELEEQPAGV